MVLKPREVKELLKLRESRGWRKARLKHKVFCDGCAHFFCPSKEWGAECLATTAYIDSPVIPKIDVKGRVNPLERNRNNDCEYRQAVSIVSWRMKKWMMERIKNGPKEGYIKKEKPVETEEPSEDIQEEIERYIEERDNGKTVNESVTTEVETEIGKDSNGDDTTGKEDSGENSDTEGT